MSEAHASTNPGANFTLVQALRGIAAFWVLLFHASEGGHIRALRAALPAIVNIVVFDSGHYGVAIFFALSGFVIAHSLRDVVPSWNFLGRFIARRSVRLDPAYWGSIVVVLLFGWLSARVKHEPFTWPDPSTIGAHLLYLQVLLQRPIINVVYWTLTYEVQFYLFLAVTLVLARSAAGSTWGRWVWPAAWAMMTLLAFGSALSMWDWLPVGLFPAFWAAFFVGVLGYVAPLNRAALVPLIILVLLMSWAPAQEDGSFLRLSALTAVILSVAFKTGYIRRGLDWAWLQFLGTISYSLYLLHNSLTGAIGFLITRYLGDGILASLVSLGAIIAVSVAGATMFWRLVELTSHRLSRRINLPRSRINETLARNF